jgi:hypothetical protein
MAEPAPGTDAPEKALPIVDERGQLVVTMQGVDYVLRPSFEAISAIERQLRPIGALGVEARDMRLSCEEMGVVVAECMKAYGKANPQDPRAPFYNGASATQAAELIYEEGVPPISARLALLLYAAVTGGFTAAGEAKAGTMSKLTTSTPAGA